MYVGTSYMYIRIIHTHMYIRYLSQFDGNVAAFFPETTIKSYGGIYIM